MSITLQSHDIDLRLQKAMLHEIQNLFDEGSNGAILDSQKFRTLYIAQVYESKKGGEKKKIEDAEDAGDDFANYESITIDLSSLRPLMEENVDKS